MGLPHFPVCMRGVAKLLKKPMPVTEASRPVEFEGMELELLELRTRVVKPRPCLADLPTADTLPDLLLQEAGPAHDADEDSDAEAQPDAALRVLAKAREAARSQRWWSGHFEKVRTLQAAPRNQGRVDLMRNPVADGDFVAVKVMPNAWATSGPEEFQRCFPESTERPWMDIGITMYLQEQGFTYVCEPRGVFRDHQSTYVVSALATEGDLFSWLSAGPKPGAEREAMLRPIMAQAFKAVAWLHDLGIAHCDISLENLLLTTEGDKPVVKLIDFGASTFARSSLQVAGKPSYMAPEIHEGTEYDPFLVDAFSLGVVLFSLAACAYPWNSTRPGHCKMFDFIRTRGLRPYMQRRKLHVQGGSVSLAEAFSPALTSLLEGLLAMRPAERLTLGEHRWTETEGTVRPSCSDSQWWESHLSSSSPVTA